MEVWTLDHPRLGTIRVEQGYDAEFRELHPDWPEDPPLDDDGRTRVGVRAPLDARPAARLKARPHNPPLRLQVSVDGQVVGRYQGASSTRLPLSRSTEALTKLVYGDGRLDRSKPHLRIQTNIFQDLLEVEFRQGDTVVEFDPPAGSRGQKRHDAMESSNIKRVAYPMLAGLGKGGWAILVLVLGPIINRLIPDWHIDLPNPPQISLPVPPRPDLHLPVPHFPQMHLPVPTIDLPALPGWLVMVLDHDEIWKPVAIAIGLGIIGLRNHRRSEAEKKIWATPPPTDNGADPDGAGTV